MDILGPAGESLRLAQHYGAMSDGELIDLAQHSSELTDLARAALAQEVSTRRLEIPPVEEEPDPEPAPLADDADEGSAYAEEREIVGLCTVWSYRDAEPLQNLLDAAGIPFYMGKEKATRVSKVTSNFSSGVSVGVMRAGLPWASNCLRHFEPKDEPLDEKRDLEVEVAIHCPKCHSEDVIFDHLSGDSQFSQHESDEDSEPADVEDEQTEPGSTSRKFDWTCASCGYKWEDEGVETK